MHRRKRVALFANGWTKEGLMEVGKGVSRCAAENDTDVFAFVDYSLHLGTEEEKRGEFNIFLLPDLKDFDGVILMTNSFNLQREKEYLYQKIMELHIPAISLEGELEGIDFIGSENYSGMYELSEHLIKEHGASEIVFMEGIPGHPDSEMRKKALLDAAAANGVTIPKENIVCGSWSDGEAARRAEEWIRDHGKCPDVFMCANDIMALGACDWLKNNGYRVPEDVKITGYDCIDAVRTHKPTITSVTKELGGMGEAAMRQLLDKINGKETPPRAMSRSKVVYGQSCGCKQAEDNGSEEERRLPIASKIYDGMAIDQHFRHMYMSVRKAETLEDFHGSMSYFTKDAGWMEGKDFMLCIHPQFFELSESDEVYKQPGYGEEVNVVCALSDGVPQECHRALTREVIFSASERKEKPGIYIFAPVHSDDMNLGFAMLTESFDIASEYMLYIWTRHVNQYLEQIRSNVKIAELTKKLQELSVTDALTGLYNRMGCEKILYPFVEECQKRGGRGIVMLADIDRMKTINDKFGHGQGDLALMTVAGVLKTEMPKGFMSGRFGGDEFFIVGESDEEISLEALAEHMTRQLAKEVQRAQIVFLLSISVGGIQLERGEKFQLNDCLQRVDQFLYKVKEKHHQWIDAQTN